jgi:uncharacterized small protein (DUF1192 family)
LKRLIIAIALLTSPALSQEIMECVGGKVQLRARINQLEAEIAKAKAEAATPDATQKNDNSKSL